MTIINGERLLKDLRDLAQYGKCGTGVNRPAFSDDDLAAREWIMGRLESAGLTATVDRYGNVYGEARGASSAVLIGSHTDTVPEGGWLDGAMGVMYALEITRARREQGEGGVEVISFMDEEGTYLPFLGSRAFCGMLPNQEWEEAKGPRGSSLGDVIRERWSRTRPVQLDRNRYVAYLEAHVEQGPRLEAANRRIGIVTGIVGMHRYRVSVIGQADHAGTTPMAMRRDAGMVLIAIARTIAEVFPKHASADTVWNIGSIAFAPGVSNVVPAGATMTVEYRDTNQSTLEKFGEVLYEITAAHAKHTGLPVDTSVITQVEPVAMDPLLAETIAASTRHHGETPMLMPSGAGHDAQVVAKFLPTAMLLVPSIGGRSHTVVEDTNKADIVLGCQVLADATDRILAR